MRYLKIFLIYADKHPTGGQGGGGGGGGNFGGGGGGNFGGGGGDKGGKLESGRYYCCLRRRQDSCPVAQDYDDYDEYYDGDDDYFGDVDLDINARNKDKDDGIGTRIVNKPPGGGRGGGSGALGSCPRRRKTCCYARKSVAEGWGNQCQYLGDFSDGSFSGGGGGSFGSGGGGFGGGRQENWEQGCGGRVRGRGKQCGTRNFRHAPGR